MRVEIQMDESVERVLQYFCFPDRSINGPPYQLCDHDEKVADFLDAGYSKLLLPNIFNATWITSTSATLIDNIFTSDYDNTFTSGNLAKTLSDHLAQVLIVPIQNTTRYKEPK